MAKMMAALVTVYRAGVAIFVVRAKTASVISTLGEAPENDALIEGGLGLRIVGTDTIRVSIGSTNYGPFNISTITRSVVGDSVSTALTLAGCGSVLRDIPVVNDDIFASQSNITSFEKVSSYIAQEAGVTFPVSFVNLEEVLMDATFSVRSTNALDMLRSLAGATGNALRITQSCTIEVGKFGADSGIFLTNVGRESLGPYTSCTLDNYNYDASDTYSWLFAEGGSFLKNDESVNLMLGSRGFTTFTIDPPTGFKIVEIEAGTRLHYKLVKIGAVVKRGKRIQIAAITPKVLNSLDSEIAAANLLAKSASLYLAAKSEPEVSVEVKVDGAISLKVGDKARVYIACPSGDIIDASLYAISVRVSTDGASISSTVSLSNRINDPEELLKAAETVKLGATGRKVHQVTGSQGTTLAVSPGFSADSCGGLSKQVYIYYAYANFAATPAFSIEADPGISMFVATSSQTEATLCFDKLTPWDGREVVKVVMAGPRNV